MKRPAAIAVVMALAMPALAAGIDSRGYSCADLQRLVTTRGFVFISQATFGDFVVASDTFCRGDDRMSPRSVATADRADCPVNYCEQRGTGRDN